VTAAVEVTGLAKNAARANEMRLISFFIGGNEAAAVRVRFNSGGAMMPL